MGKTPEAPKPGDHDRSRQQRVYLHVAEDITIHEASGITTEQQRLLQTLPAAISELNTVINLKLKEGLQPVAHGTQSQNLRSIIEFGLGAVRPKGSGSPLISATAAEYQDGVLGAHMFATWHKTHQLGLQRTDVSSIDVLQRYSNLTGNRIQPEHLRAQFDGYFAQRAFEIGEEFTTAYPVLLFYGATPDVIQDHNQAVPSERRVRDGQVLPKEQLFAVYVPADKIEETRLLMTEIAPDLLQTVIIKPIEMFELL